MAFIKVNNNDNYILIDDNFQNYVHAKTENYTFYIVEPSGIWRDNPVPFYYEGHSNSSPVIAIRANGGNTIPIPFGYTKTGNTYAFRFYGARGSPATGGPPLDVSNRDIVVFDRPISGSGASGLVVVRDSFGRITYSSDLKYMNVLREVTSGQSMTIPSNSGIIYASNTMGYSFIQVGSFVGWQFATTFATSSSSVALSTEHRVFDSYLGSSYTPPPSGWPSNTLVGTLRGLVVDLTGFI